MMAAPKSSRRFALWAGLICGGAGLLSSAAAAPLPFQPTLLDDESYAEQFNAIADTEEGTYVHLQLGVSNVGFGDGNAACRVLVIEPGREAWTQTDKRGASEWRFAAEPYPRLQVGDCYLRGGQATEALAVVGGGRVRMTIAAAPVEVEPPGHRVVVGAGADAPFYELAVLIPGAPVRIEWQRPGGRSRVLSGQVWVDHSRSTALPAQSARGWVRFRQLRDAETLMMTARLPPGGGAGIGWVWKAGEERPAPLSLLRLVPAGADGVWTAEFAAAGISYRAVSGSLLYRFAPLEDSGMLGPAARLVVGNPVTRTYRSRLQVGGQPAALDGIFEVALHD
jgi:hypothetical protein